jgi:putative hydrolase of the HAD superfamily
MSFQNHETTLPAADQIKHVVFDIDGVVAEGPPRVSEVAIAKFGLDANAVTNFFSRGPWEGCIEGSGDLRELLIEALPQWGFSGSVDDYLRFWFETANVFNARVIDLAAKLRAQGLGCHLASNQEKIRAASLWHSCKLSDHFDSAFFSCHMGCKKPHASFYDAVRQQVHAEPHEIVLLDDSLENVQAAKQCGWHGILWPDETSIARALMTRGSSFYTSHI